MFCCTESGRGAICRQLEPSVHIDSSPIVVEYLAPHLSKLVLVDPTAHSAHMAKGAVSSAASLEAYVGQSCAQP